MAARLYVICICACLFAFVASVSPEKSLLWIPNNEGIMSQFIQIKIMLHFARVSGRKLISAPFSTAHVDSKKNRLCDLFELPGLLYQQRHCVGWQYSKMNSSVPELCAHGSVPSMGGETRRDTLLHGIKLPQPRLVIHKRFSTEIEMFLKNLGITKDVRYTVVHWRRGDQFNTRCKQNKDVSVNCGSARELISNVQSLSRDKLIYVATNEPANSSDSQILMEAGFKLFHHGLSGSLNVTSESITGFMIDLTLMIRCTTFLGWGVSLMNDVVEHQRLLAHRSYCTSYVEKDTIYPTWCWLKNQELKPSNIVILRKAKKVGGLPFITLSKLNTSLMPSYELERKENYNYVFRSNVV